MRIAGATIPSEKRLVISLRYIFGVGQTRAKEICEKVKIDENVRVKNLTPEQEEQIREVLKDFNFVLDADLRREISQNVKRLQDIGSYRGFRHRRRLPLRGQRTKTNARTRKGRKGMAVAKKKIAKK
jgi:small subunit ribosomal protein S13